MLGERYDTHLELKVNRLKYPDMVLDCLPLSFHSLILYQPTKFHQQISSKVWGSLKGTT